MDTRYYVVPYLFDDSDGLVRARYYRGFNKTYEQRLINEVGAYPISKRAANRRYIASVFNDDNWYYYGVDNTAYRGVLARPSRPALTSA